MPDFYGTASGFTDYHAARANVVPVDFDEDSEIEIELLIGSEWLDARFKSSFEGSKTGGRDQLREFPRIGHVDRYGYDIATDEIPREIENATYEIALIHMNDAAALRIDNTPSKYRQAAVDGAVNVTFNDFTSSSEAQTQFQIVGEIMSGIIYSGSAGNSSNLSGSVARA